MPDFDSLDDSLIDVNEGSPFHINCKISAVPTPKLTWFKDGVLVKPDDRIVIYPDGRTLQVLAAKLVIVRKNIKNLRLTNVVMHKTLIFKSYIEYLLIFRYHIKKT